jgi:AraC family transcriptional regulator, regulatory protein of adaptative response / methylated-DNA-[protein]-cysteine methyltransferase
MTINAVITTGIYCRPGCPARPRPENVRHFTSTAEARAAGFRPCKRCRPDAELIRYAVVPSRHGRLLVATTERGVCAVTLGDRPEALEKALRAEFPDAFVQHDAALELLAERIEAGSADGVALDLRGTPFQREVWGELQRIPVGETRTYTDVAAALGRPSAVRAVASACASNHVGLLVPCHRVLRRDGGLGGFRWGIERKRALLATER